MAERRIVADHLPADAVGRRGRARHDPFAAPDCLHRRVVNCQELARGVAAVVVEDDRAVVKVAHDDIRLCAVAKRLAVVAHRLAPVQRVLRFSIAEDDLGSLRRICVAAHQRLVPHLIDAVVRIVQGCRGHTGEMIAFPGQVFILNQRDFRLLRLHDDPLRVDQFVQDVVVEKELLLRTDMLEWEPIGRVEVGIGAGVNGALARPGLLHHALRVDPLCLASRFRRIGLFTLVHRFPFSVL